MEADDVRGRVALFEQEALRVVAGHKDKCRISEV
jgi:hypothetical protein